MAYRLEAGEGSFALKNLPAQTFLLRYLLEGKAVPALGTFKTFREMPWGELYIQPFTGRWKLGAEKLPHGDAGYALELLPGFTMELLVWAGDDEFPPSAQILYSDNFEQGFAPEDRVVAGDLLISIVKTYL